MDTAFRFLHILEVLARHGVEFIVVGGVAAILEGAPVSTFDLDVVVRPTAEDRDHLLEVANLRVRTLRLGMIIRSKEEADRDKDQATLPILRRTLRLKSGASE